MSWILGISIVTVIAYIAVVIYKIGIPKSISVTYYKLPHKYSYLFSFAILALSVPIIIISDSLLMQIAGGLICLVAATPRFKHCKNEKLVHIIGATSGVLLALASMAFNYDLGVLVGFNAWVAFTLWLFKGKNIYFWIEIMVIISVWIALSI